MVVASLADLTQTVCGTPLIRLKEKGSKLEFGARCTRAMYQHIVRYSLQRNQARTHHWKELERALFLVDEGGVSHGAAFEKHVNHRVVRSLEQKMREMEKLGAVTLKERDEDGVVVQVYADWTRAWLRCDWDASSFNRAELASRKLLARAPVGSAAELGREEDIDQLRQIITDHEADKLAQEQSRRQHGCRHDGQHDVQHGGAPAAAAYGDEHPPAAAAGGSNRGGNMTNRPKHHHAAAAAADAHDNRVKKLWRALGSGRDLAIDLAAELLWIRRTKDATPAAYGEMQALLAEFGRVVADLRQWEDELERAMAQGDEAFVEYPWKHKLWEPLERAVGWGG
ncbi:hypothetical protein LY76DRAFT_598758 [Colletotrichum caudatum]|nr:hypothetical protein LY76DRAFT_598758 [Colletotrichum caudatum]